VRLIQSRPELIPYYLNQLHRFKKLNEQKKATTSYIVSTNIGDVENSKRTSKVRSKWLTDD
jgi:hypothetical protein